MVNNLTLKYSSQEAFNSSVTFSVYCRKYYIDYVVEKLLDIKTINGKIIRRDAKRMKVTLVIDFNQLLNLSDISSNMSCFIGFPYKRFEFTSLENITGTTSDNCQNLYYQFYDSGIKLTTNFVLENYNANFLDDIYHRKEITLELIEAQSTVVGL